MTLVTLTRYEARRYVRSPVLLVALALTAYAIYDLTRNVVSDADEVPTPTPARVRTVALCLTALVPFVCGVLSLIAILVFRDVAGDWTDGAFSTADRTAVLVSQIALPSLGGPLLGFALGRWVRAAWVGPALFLIIVAWILVVEGLA